VYLKAKRGEKRFGKQRHRRDRSINERGYCGFHAATLTGVKTPGASKPVLFWAASQDAPSWRSVVTLRREKTGDGAFTSKRFSGIRWCTDDECYGDLSPTREERSL